jgi:para-nitrobenzyl esterase
MQDAWLAFAKKGDPNHRGIPQWHTYSAARRATMVFDGTIHEVEDPYKLERMAWIEAGQAKHREGP